jgi:sterol desaturase/sphingolipid hydroxylase (fatty acid hydroxylase superfamily)
VSEIQDAVLAAVRVAYPGLGVGAFLLFWLWEGGRPRVGFAAPGRHTLRNLALFVLVVLFADELVGTAILGIPARRLEVPPGLLAPLALPLPVTIVVGIVVADLACYAYHRLSHRLRPLWLLHAVHHTDPHLDASTAVRFHPFDMACYVVIIAATLVGLGIPLWVEGVRAALLNPLLLAQHANVVFPPSVERWLAWLFVTPAMHRVHHATDKPEIDSNYGQMFSFWDRLFGSYRAPASADPPLIGVRGFEADAWQSVGGMLLTPWRGRRSL